MSSIKNHCQHCGEEVPYHGPWKNPETLLEYARGDGDRSIIFRKYGNTETGTIVYFGEGGRVLIDSQIQSNMPVADIVGWMPAPRP